MIVVPFINATLTPPGTFSRSGMSVSQEESPPLQGREDVK
jgi:hypothetical protein